MPDDIDINKEETVPVVNPFEDVVKYNQVEKATKKEKDVMGVIEACMNRVGKLICHQVEKIKILKIEGKLRKFKFVE